MPAIDRRGNVAFFNSIGAGLNINRGTYTSVTDKDNEEINQEFENIIGAQLGFLFSSNSTTSSNNNIFALTFGLSILNFQLGYGHELGSVLPNEKRDFITLAYGIPLSALVKGGFHILKAWDKKAEAVTQPKSLH